MNAIRSAASILKTYDPNCSLVDQLKHDAAGLRGILAKTIADNHPNKPSDVPLKTFIVLADSFCPLSKSHESDRFLY